ncbi:MAG: MBL fold metallo-hydrolase [Chitinispirillaceae bacterium]|nr:MBL fold metallo-hydrolase [Chitinispirillaceae bacterium]
MHLTCRQLNPGPCKTYMIGNDTNSEVALIDPVIDRIDAYRWEIDSGGYTLTMVIDTHTHADHISGGSSLKDLYNCEYLMHGLSPVKCAGMHLEDGEEVRIFGTVPVNVMHTPGHTRDSVSLMFPEWLFTGDALFLDDGGAGRDDLPGGDAGAHWESLRKLQELPDSLIVYPAHDYRDRQPLPLGKQKTANPHLKKSRESREAFVQYLEDLKLGPADWMKEVLKANYACARDPKAAWIPADLPACEIKGTMSSSANEVVVESITPEQLRMNLEASGTPVLLDVREAEELDGPLGYMEGIIHIPIGRLTARLDELEQYREREIVTVCRSGGRAATAAQILSVAGFRAVSVLEGGLIGWNAM